MIVSLENFADDDMSFTKKETQNIIISKLRLTSIKLGSKSSRGLKITWTATLLL